MSSRLWIGLCMSGLLSLGCMRPKIETPMTAAKPEVPVVKKKLGLPGDRRMTLEQKSISQALDDEREVLKSRFEELPAKAQPSEVVAIMDELIAKMAQVDLNDCPAEFRNDHAAYLLAWKELRAAMSRLPDAYTDASFLKHFRGLFVGDAQAERVVGGAVKLAAVGLAKAQNQIYLTARQYGLVELE